MEKKVFIINGRSGVGKDTLINILAEKFPVRNVSSVDQIKLGAMVLGWDGVKDERGRQFLIDIKASAVKYGDLPTQHMAARYDEFMRSEDQFMFIHIREISEIEKLVAKISCKTLLITRQMENVFDNIQDDCVAQYNYDIIFANDKPLEQSGKDFIKLMTK